MGERVRFSLYDALYMNRLSRDDVPTLSSISANKVYMSDDHYDKSFSTTFNYHKARRPDIVSPFNYVRCYCELKDDDIL